MKGEFIDYEQYDAIIDLYQRVNGPPASPEVLAQLETTADELVQDRAAITTRSYSFKVDDRISGGGEWELAVAVKEARTEEVAESFVSFLLEHSHNPDPLLETYFDSTNTPREIRLGSKNSLTERMVAHDALKKMLYSRRFDFGDTALLESMQEYIADLTLQNAKTDDHPQTHVADLARELVSRRTKRGIKKQMFSKDLVDGRHLSVEKSQELYYTYGTLAPLEMQPWIVVTLSLPDSDGALYYSNYENQPEIQDDSLDADDPDQEGTEKTMDQARRALSPAFPRASQAEDILAALQQATDSHTYPYL